MQVFKQIYGLIMNYTELEPNSKLGDGKLDSGDVVKALTFWQKYKTKIWPIILIAVGALGGNADRLADFVGSIPEYLPTVSGVSREEFEELKLRVDTLEKPRQSIYTVETVLADQNKIIIK